MAHRGVLEACVQLRAQNALSSSSAPGLCQKLRSEISVLYTLHASYSEYCVTMLQILGEVEEKIVDAQHNVPQNKSKWRSSLEELLDEILEVLSKIKDRPKPTIVDDELPELPSERGDRSPRDNSSQDDSSSDVDSDNIFGFSKNRNNTNNNTNNNDDNNNDTNDDDNDDMIEEDHVTILVEENEGVAEDDVVIHLREDELRPLTTRAADSDSQVETSSEEEEEEIPQQTTKKRKSRVKVPAENAIQSHEQKLLKQAPKEEKLEDVAKQNVLPKFTEKETPKQKKKKRENSGTTTAITTRRPRK